MTWHTRKWEVAAKVAGFSMENVRFKKPGDSHTQIKEPKYMLFGVTMLFFVCVKAIFCISPESLCGFWVLFMDRDETPGRV